METRLSAMQEAALLAEWRALLDEQRHLKQERVDGLGGLVGILVAKDELAIQYQAAQSRIYDITRELGVHFWRRML